MVITAVLGQIPSVGVDAVSVVSSPSTDSSGTTTWDCIFFGNYWQNDTNNDGTADSNDEKEPIQWRVLSVKDNKAVLMSEQILAARKFDEKAHGDVSCSWETSTIRTWLNQTFYAEAFSGAEQDIIQASTVNDVDNPSTNQKGGGETEDKVYLLSIADAVRKEYGFDTEWKCDSETRAAKATAYAAASGYNLKGWYLITRGLTQKDTVYVKSQGAIDDWGYSSYITEGIRPVICIDLGDSSLWESAGTVTAAKKPTATEKPATPTPVPTKKPVTTKKPTVTPVPKKPAPTTTMAPGTKKAISSFEDLQDMENIPSGNYYLKNDITVPKNARIFCDYPFTGILDGCGHKIKGYRVDKTIVSGPLQENNVYSKPEEISWDAFWFQTRFGLFDKASNATFKNISMTNVKITVRTDCVAGGGSLVADADACTFDNVHASGKISVKSTRENPVSYSSFSIGGIAGGGSGKMINCSNSAGITADIMNGYDSNGDFVGGLAGNFTFRLLKNCSNSGNLSLSGYSGWDLNGGKWFGVAGLTMGTPYNDGSSAESEKYMDETSLVGCTNSGNITFKPTSKGKEYYDTPTYSLPDKHEKLWCSDIFAVGLVPQTQNVKSCGNTGKIKASSPFTRGSVYVAGLAAFGNGKLSRCRNEGSISFSGCLKKEMSRGSEVWVGGLFSKKAGGKSEVITECYNKGNINVKLKNKNDVKMHVELANRCRIGGIVGEIYTIHESRISNCYNAGNITVKFAGPSQRVGGIGGSYHTWGGYAKYNYNVGRINMKHKDKWVKTQGGAIFSEVADARMPKLRLATDNYYTKLSTKLFVAYESHESVIKKLMPTSKKVSKITKANCPKLSSKYWKYSKKAGRLVLKKNDETKKAKKNDKAKKAKKNNKAKKKKK